MDNQPKNHHYIPRFHLARFTLSGNEDGRLFVLDKRQRRTWSSTPKKTARKNNFYKVDLENLDPMGIEKGFAEVECKCAGVVRDILTTNVVPTGDAFEVLINFVALAHVRVPSVRSTTSRGIDQMMRKLAHISFFGPKGTQLLRNLAAMDGQTLADEEIQQLQEFIASDEYTIGVDQNSQIRWMIEAVDMLLPALGQRHWAVWTAADDAPDLVCSDRPVVLWPGAPSPFPPTFATPNTLLTIPLSRRTLLASRLEEMPSDTYVMDSVDVALMNTFRTLYANQIYSAQESWVWTAHGEILGSQALLDELPPVKDGSNSP